jgi:DNA-binding GntR family transcriptional regulator
MKTVSSKPDLVEQVHHALIESIVTGELPAGERLTQEELAERFGVSRQPVLQAILLLRQQGLILEAPNKRGLFVAPMDAEFLANLYEVRAALDGVAAAAAARRDATNRRSKGMDIIRRGRDAVANGDLRQLVRADRDFHMFIYQLADNPLLLASATLHWHHTQRAMSGLLAKTNSLKGIWTEHQQILEAILKQDARSAERLSRRHADNALDQLLEFVSDTE